MHPHITLYGSGFFNSSGEDKEYHSIWTKHGQKLKRLRKTKKTK